MERPGWKYIFVWIADKQTRRNGELYWQAVGSSNSLINWVIGSHDVLE